MTDIFKPTKAFKEQDLNKSKGILDDHSVRKSLLTREGTITHTPTNDNDIANKKYVDDEIAGSGGGTGLWEVDGTETQLKTADEIDMQTKKILNVVDPTANQEAATKKYVDDNSGIFDANIILTLAAAVLTLNGNVLILQ